MFEYKMHTWLPRKEGEFRVCKNCGMPENACTFDCCHRPVTEEEKEQVKQEQLDYVNGKWRVFVSFV